MQLLGLPVVCLLLQQHSAHLLRVSAPPFRAFTQDDTACMSNRTVCLAAGSHKHSLFTTVSNDPICILHSLDTVCKSWPRYTRCSHSTYHIANPEEVTNTVQT